MSSDTLSVRLLQGADVTYKRVRDGALLLDAFSGKCFALNRLGAEVWSLLNGNRTLEDVCATLENVLDVPPQVLRTDVVRFAVDLESVQLVREVSVTEVASEDIEDFLERHAFALFPDGGLVMNLQSGSYSALNASAAAFLDLIRGTRRWEDAIALARNRWGFSGQEAGAALEELRKALARAERTPVMELDYPYLPFESGYALHHRGRPLLAVDGDADHVRLMVRPTELPLPLERCLRFVSPKILNALGRVVLHAAANELDRSLLVLSGVSGAGKSTTSRLLAEAGVPKVADEFLVVSIRGDTVVARLDAEAHIVRWCSRAAQMLAAAPLAPVSCKELIEPATQTREARVDRLLLLDSTRRDSRLIETERLPASRAVEHLLQVVFLGVLDPPGLRRFLADCRALALALRTEVARVPGDLDSLARALRSYSLKTAS